MAKANVHYCELKQDNFGLPKLPPNVPWYRKFGRSIRKLLTLNPNSTASKRFFRNRSTMISEQRRHLHGSPFIIHPFSTVNRVREALFCILWTIEMIVTPLYISFILIDLSYHKKAEIDIKKVYETFFFFYRNILSPMEAIVMATFFFTGYINTKTKEIVIQPTKIWKKYLCTYYIIDLMMNLKFGIYTDVSRLMYLCNMFCMLRAGTVFSYLKEIVLNCKMQEEVHDCLRLFVITLIILNGFTCFYYYLPWIGNDEHFTEYTWPVRTEVAPQHINSLETNHSIARAYTESMLAVVCHFFGAGEGIHGTDFNDFLQKLMLVVIMISGRIWTLYVIACILKIFSVVTISESKFEEYLLQLEVFMRQKRLPQVLRKRLLEYYRYKYQNHYFNEMAIFNTLSAYLRQELMLYGARKLITKVDLFRALPRSVVGAIISQTKQIVYLPGDVIVKRGDIADDILFISSGTVAMSTANDEELVHLEDGDEIGLVGSFTPQPYVYIYNYHAVETTEVYAINKKDFRALIFDQEDLLKYFAKKVQEKIDSYKAVEESYQIHGYDLLSELSGGKILERPRFRPTHFEH